MEANGSSDLGDGRPRAGPNPLFFGTLLALVLGAVAAVTADDSKLLHSNVLFRVAVGMAVFAVAYVVIVILWWAWHGKTVRRLGFGGAEVEGPSDSDRSTVDAAISGYEAIVKRAETAEAMIDSLKEQLEVTTEQVKRLARENSELRERLNRRA